MYNVYMLCAIVAIIAPYWASVLAQPHLKAYQASERGGELMIDVVDYAGTGADAGTVHISGRAVVIMRGQISL
jgi:predicted PhzF superfamily epimerase YddE/YHI9